MLHKIISEYFDRKIVPYWGVLLLDCLIVFGSYLVSYAIWINIFPSLQNLFNCLIYLIIYIIFFIILHTYNGILRYSSYIDIMRLVSASFFSLLTICFIHIILGHYLLLSKEVIIFGWCLSSFLLCSIRVLVKQIYDNTMSHSKRLKNVIIYGTMEVGVSIARSIRSSQINGYIVKGFISDDSEKIGHILLGQKVYPNELKKIKNLNNIDAIIVSPLKRNLFLNNKSLVEGLINEGIKIMMAPPISEWGDGVLKKAQIKELQIEDLLSRDTIKIDLSNISSQLEGQVIMITGAAGSIGSEMVRQVSKFNPKNLILVDQAETPMHDLRLFMNKNYSSIECETLVASITNSTRMNEIFNKFRPNYVFHAAAYKHVPMMEDNVSESIQNNIYGTKVISDLAVKYNVEKFVMISTDKAVNPTNIMGCSKRICEIYVQSLNNYIRSNKKGITQFITTRFGNVLGSNGSVIPLFKRQIESGGPITVTHPDIIRYFMTIPEACKLVLEAGYMGKGGEIFVFDMGKPVKIVDLAKNMIRLSGAEGIKIIFTGLRDGEKLYEELLSTKEKTKKTFNDKIMIAAVREYNYLDISKRIDELVKLSYNYNEMEIVNTMKIIVPEFKSQNSRFEILDKK